MPPNAPAPPTPGDPAAAASAAGPEFQPAEPVRLLQASVRCLLLGVAGLVPVLGAGIAVVALRLGAELMEWVGEEWDWDPFVLLWVAGAVELVFLHSRTGLFPALLAWLALYGVQTLLLARRYWTGRPIGFNAARREVYWGVGLAMTGLATSVLGVGLLVGTLISTHRP